MYLKFLDLPVAALESQRLTMSWKNPDSLITCKCCSSNSDENIMAVFIKDKKSGIKNEKVAHKLIRIMISMRSSVKTLSPEAAMQKQKVNGC